MENFECNQYGGDLLGFLEGRLNSVRHSPLASDPGWLFASRAEGIFSVNHVWIPSHAQDQACDLNWLHAVFT